MKPIPTPAIAAAAIGLLLATFAPASRAEDSGKKISLKRVYQEARTAFHRGDYDAAREKFELILRYQPGHGPSRSYLTHIAQAEAARGGNRTLEKRLAGLVMESVEFDEVTLIEAVEYLVLSAEKATEGEFKPNIVLKGLDEERRNKTIRLKLSNVPMNYVLKMVGELGGVRFEYEKYAIVGSPAPTTADGVSGTGDADPATDS